jgi:hypothetical protein
MPKTRLPEIVEPGRRLGRHINHDPQSLRFRVGRTATPKTVRHERRVPIFDQGNLGSCTINATLGVLGTDPFYDTLPTDLQALLRAPDIQARLVQPLYREVTKLDPFDGAWEPDDTGSDGLSAAKVAKNHGLISGYRHITTIGEAHAAIQDGPFIIGTIWMSGMDNPSREGIVTASGYERGGHEYYCLGYDAARDLWEVPNSWSTDYGLNGYFKLDTPNLAKLLSMQGDATPFVPITAPAPQPTPAPVNALADFPWAQLEPWRTAPHVWSKATTAAKALTTWKTRHAL